MTHAHQQATIKVKFLAKSKPGFDPSIWLRRFPNRCPEIDECRFIFDRDCRDYDWLVVYDDLPSVSGERFTLWTEKLACPKSNTLLITTEPAIIKVYGSGYIQQFGRVLTSQEPDIVKSPGVIRAQCGLVYFYGGQTEKGLTTTLLITSLLTKPAISLQFAHPRLTRTPCTRIEFDSLNGCNLNSLS